MEIKTNNSNINILEPKIIEPKQICEDSKHIILVHGFAIDSRCWELYVEKNYKNYIHLINLPGHGTLQYTKRELEFDSMVNYIKDYILSLNLNNIVLIGHSFGAAISLVVNEKLKQENKNVLEKLILMAPYSKYSISKVYNKIPIFNVKNANDFLTLQKMIFENTESTLDRLKKYFYEEEVLDFFKRNSKYLKYVILQMSRFTTFYKINNAFDYIDKNTYFLFGENDKLVPNRLVINRAQEIEPSIYVSIYKDCGHGFFVEKDDLFFNEIQNIIDNKVE